VSATLPRRESPVPLSVTPSLAAAASRTPERSAPPVALVTLTVMLGLIMAIIDTSIVNVALTNMAGSLGSTIDEISWVATGYILANVIVMPLNGWLTARFGRKNYYAACLVLFTVSSLLCGTASNVWLLVFYRVLQGFGGGALQPTAQAILFESYPVEKRGNAMAIFGLGAMVGPAIGPTLGGFLVDNFSWPLIFFVNVPIGIVAFVMTLAFIRDQKYVEKPKGGLDWTALSLMTVGLAALQYVLERGQHDDWFSSPTIVVLTAVAAVTLTLFVVREIRDRAPLVDLKVFASRAFTAGCVIGVVSGFGLYGLNLVLPLFFQNVLGFDATQTGLALLPGAVATALSMPIAGRLVGKLDPRISIAAGIAMFGASAFWMGGLDQNAGYWDIFWPRNLQGFALGFLFVPLTTAALATVPLNRMAGATGVYTLVRQLGGSFGIAILELLQTRQEDAAQSTLVGRVNDANPAVHAFLQHAASKTQALQQLAGMVGQNATVISYDFVFRLSGILFFAAIPTVFLLAGKRKGGGPAPPVVAAE
jgi:DHA2 family multidrug resistance protein